MMESPEELIDKDTVHYQKINIFGESEVGKSSLISLLENYNNDNYILTKRDSNLSQISYDNDPVLINQIKQIKFNINDDKVLYYNIYETSLNKYNTIKLNLDVLLVQSECIIIMWDNSEPETFSNIENLFDTIQSKIKENNMNDIPIILLQNKTDKELNKSELSNPEEINKTVEIIKNKKKNNLTHLKASLLNKDDLSLIALEINRIISYNQNNNNDINNIKFKYPIKNFIKKHVKGYKKETMDISLIGESNTGKSSFLYYLEEKPIDNIKSTIGNDESHLFVNIHGEKVNVKIRDTAGQEKYQSITKDLIQKSHGFLLFFDVTNKDAKEGIEKYLAKIKDENSNDCTDEIILIGNKIDEIDKREFLKNDAKEYANEKGIKYYECSTKFGINVYEILNEIIFLSYSKYKEKKEQYINQYNDNKILDNKILDNNSINKNERDCRCFC